MFGSISWKKIERTSGLPQKKVQRKIFNGFGEINEEDKKIKRVTKIKAVWSPGGTDFNSKGS